MSNMRLYKRYMSFTHIKSKSLIVSSTSFINKCFIAGDTQEFRRKLQNYILTQIENTKNSEPSHFVDYNLVEINDHQLKYNDDFSDLEIKFPYMESHLWIPKKNFEDYNDMVDIFVQQVINSYKLAYWEAEELTFEEVLKDARECL